MRSTVAATLLSASFLWACVSARNVDWCASSAQTGGTCQNIYLDDENVAQQIGSQLYTDASNDDCTIHSGSIDDLYYRVYATTTGGNCESTAEVGTIQGALYNWIQTEYENGDLCGSQCVRLSHGGTWTGWLAISTSSSALNSFTCDSSVSVPNCGSCGKDCLP